jgi:hypothetical protein
MEDDGLCRRLMHGAFKFAQEWNEQVLATLRKSFDIRRDPVPRRELKELNH